LTGTEYKTHNTFNSTWVHPGFSEFRISRSLVLCLIFCRSLSLYLPALEDISMEEILQI
jgi:hypothetical protein